MPWTPIPGGNNSQRDENETDRSSLGAVEMGGWRDTEWLDLAAYHGENRVTPALASTI